MDVETGMRQIHEAVQNTVGTQNYGEETETAYRRAIEEVERLADGSAVEDLVGWVSNAIREGESLPAPGTVDERAAEICRERGAEIPPESRLADA
jgi:hypothetical protein